MEYLAACPTLARPPVSDGGIFSVVVMVSMVIPSNLAWVWSVGLAAAAERLMAQGTAVTIGAESGMFSTWRCPLVFHSCARPIARMRPHVAHI